MAQEGVDSISWIFSQHVSSTVEFVDEASAVVELVKCLVGLDETPPEIADIGRANVKPSTQVVISLVQHPDHF